MAGADDALALHGCRAHLSEENQHAAKSLRPPLHKGLEMDGGAGSETCFVSVNWPVLWGAAYAGEMPSATCSCHR